MRLLLVRVGGLRLAVSADAVARIVDPAVEGDFLPGGPGGRIRWRGTEYPAVDLRGVAGEPKGGEAVYLLVDRGRTSVFLRVDAAETIRDVAADRIAPLPPFIFATPRRFVRGLFADPDGPRLLIDEGAIA
ncbi:MAG: chemotaxis protein CheW [Candidatus Polarisedimenticolia bacterium]